MHIHSHTDTQMQEPVSGAILDELLVLEPDSWELHAVPPAQQAGLRPPARHSHVAGVFERDSLVVFGGAGLRGPLNDVHTFDTRTHTWAKLSAGLEPRACPEPREMAAVGAQEGMMRVGAGGAVAWFSSGPLEFFVLQSCAKEDGALLFERTMLVQLASPLRLWRTCQGHLSSNDMAPVLACRVW